MALYENPPYYLTAYGLALRHGFHGTEEEWLRSLRGPSAYEVAVENGYQGTETEWLQHLRGASAYEVAVLLGYGGTAEEWLESLIGPQGEAGPQGERGERGPEGQRGIQGDEGPAGPTGPRGERGEQGPEGPQGIRGEVGPEGPPGPQGERGERGPEGPPGPQGERGERGPEGPQGVQGEDGPVGPRGPQGERGEPGKDFKVLGYYQTLQELEEGCRFPEAGDAYGVGAAAPYRIYIWNGVRGTWTDNGNVQGPEGKPGRDGIQLVIGAEEPADGPVLWLDTGWAAEKTKTVLLQLGKGGEDGELCTVIDAVNYPITNAKSETAKEPVQVEIL